MPNGNQPERSINSGNVGDVLRTAADGYPAWQAPGQTAFKARGACYATQSLTAFVGVTGGTAQDGVTYIAGDIVLLAAQTTAADCGLYVVGTVAVGVAPLTRLSSMAFGTTGQNGCTVEVSEGTLWAGSTWKAMATTTGGFVVGTNDPVFYPRVCKNIITLASGTYTLGSTEGLFLWSATRSGVQCMMNTPGGTLTSTLAYGSNSAGRTIGKSGAAALIVIARVAAGTIDTANSSTVDVLVTNW